MSVIEMIVLLKLVWMWATPFGGIRVLLLRRSLATVLSSCRSIPPPGPVRARARPVQASGPAGNYFAAGLGAGQGRPHLLFSDPTSGAALAGAALVASLAPAPASRADGACPDSSRCPFSRFDVHADLRVSAPSTR